MFSCKKWFKWWLRGFLYIFSRVPPLLFPHRFSHFELGHYSVFKIGWGTVTFFIFHLDPWKSNGTPLISWWQKFTLLSQNTAWIWADFAMLHSIGSTWIRCIFKDNRSSKLFKVAKHVLTFPNWSLIMKRNALNYHFKIINTTNFIFRPYIIKKSVAWAHQQHFQCIYLSVTIGVKILIHAHVQGLKIKLNIIVLLRSTNPLNLLSNH